MTSTERINLIKDRLEAVVDNDDENYGAFFLCWYAVLTKFGDEYSDLIEKVFYSTEFYIDEKTTIELAAEAGERIRYTPGEKGISFASYCAGIDNQLNFLIHKDNPKICVSTINSSPNDILIVLTHEFMHILKSTLQPVIKDIEKNTVTLRRGLHLETYDITDRNFEPVCYHAGLDEAINIFQTSDILRHLNDLDSSLLDEFVKPFYDRLNLKTLSEPSGYSLYARFFMPLWNNADFKNSVDEALIVGDIHNVQENFNGIVGDGKFMKLSQAFDNLYFDYNHPISNLENITIIKNIISSYNKKTEIKLKQKIKS